MNIFTLEPRFKIGDQIVKVKGENQGRLRVILDIVDNKWYSTRIEHEPIPGHYGGGFILIAHTDDDYLLGPASQFDKDLKDLLK